VFITAYEEYAMKAFEVDAIDYLQKPVTPERFAAAVQRAISRMARGREAAAAIARAIVARSRETARYRSRFVVRVRSTHTFVGVKDIVWIDAVDNYLQLHTRNQVHLVRGTMKEAERELDPSHFLRIHRSAIVSIARIVAVDALPSGGYGVRLDEGTKLRTSRQYAGRVRRLVADR
jgi:two-component system LytT family response regulator